MAKPRDTVAASAPQLSRRSLLTSHAPALVAILAIPPLLAACGSEADQQGGGGGAAPTGQTAKSAKPRAKKRETADAKSGRETADGESEAASRADDGEAALEDTTASEQARDESVSDDGSAAEPAKPAQDSAGDDEVVEGTPQPEPPLQTNVMGASPNNGFFSNGAPTLTREQIMAGQQIRGKAEGGLHDLIIEPEHLQALARGETVTIKSSTHTHAGNPTVHNHSVTYTPFTA
jgi:hypothetical protein